MPFQRDRWAAFALSLALFHGAAAQADSAAQPGTAALPGEACQTPPAGTWTDSEKWVWDQVCTGRAADLAEHFGGSSDPMAKEPWPATRDLSLRFLQATLLREPYRSAVTIKGIRIQGAHFHESVDLTNASLIRELWLDRSQFDKGAELQAVHSTALLSMDGSRFEGPLDLERADIGGTVFLKGITASHEVRLLAVRIGSNLEMDGAKLAGKAKLSLGSAFIGGSIFLKSIEATGDIDLLGTRVGGSVQLDGATVSGEASMQRLTTGGPLFLNLDSNKVPARFDGMVDLLGASIGGAADFSGAQIKGDLSMEHATVMGDLWLSGYPDNEGQFADIDLVGAHVSGKVIIKAATFNRSLNVEDARFGQSLTINGKAKFHGAVTFSRARIDGDMEITDSVFDERVDMQAMQVSDSLRMNRDSQFAKHLNLTFARIADNLDLTEGNFSDVDLTGAVIGSEIRLGSPDDPPPTWHAPEKMTLRNVSAGALQDLPRSWPVEIDLEGFTYGRLGGFGAAGGELGRRETADFIAWLEKQKSFSPQSYMQLAAVLRESGFSDKADWILFSGRMQEFMHARWYRQIFLGLELIFTGFGIYPQLAGVWVIVLTVVGAYIFGRDRQPELARAGWVDQAIYSLDMLLPVIHLRKSNYEFEPESARARYYLYFHRMLGFLLASVLIASLTHGGIELHG